MHSVQVTTTLPKKRDYKCKCVTQSSKAAWIDKGWTYHGRVLLGSFRVLMYNGSGPFSGPFGSSFTVVGSLRVLIYSGRVPSGSSSGPFGSSFRLVGSYTPFGLYKDTTMGAGCGRYLKHSSGLWEVPYRDSSRWGGSNIVVQTLLQTGCLPEQPRHGYSK